MSEPSGDIRDIINNTLIQALRTPGKNARHIASEIERIARATGHGEEFRRMGGLRVLGDVPGDLVGDFSNLDGSCHTLSDASKVGSNLGPCPTCREPLANGDAVSVLHPCAHVFHESCCRAWDRVNMSCPMCRQPVTVRCCAVCEKKEDALPGPIQICSGCYRKWYCSRACQKADRAAHKDHCKKSTE